MAVFDKRASSLNREKNIPLSRNVEGQVIKVRIARSSRGWIVLAQFQTKRELFSSVDHHLSSTNVTFGGCSRVISKTIRGHHLLHDVHYSHVEEAYAVVLFKHSRKAQHILHRVP